MKRLVMILAAGMLALGACGPGDIEVREPWARAAMKGGNSAIYLTLSNRSSSADELVGVSCDAAEAAEIHLSQMSPDGVMQMTPQESVPLAVDAKATFEPGGLHIMLIGLTRDLAAGDTIRAVLHFKSHADITIEVPVRQMDGMDMGG